MGSESLRDMDDSGCLHPSYLDHHSVPGNGNLLELSITYTVVTRGQDFSP